MRAWWGGLSLRARLALAFGAMAAATLVFLLAIVARTLGAGALTQGKILPAALFALAMFFLGGWFVAEWCLREIGRVAAQVRGRPAGSLPAELAGLAALLRREAERHDRLLAELRRFTADAAHELRTPLTALRATGEVALRGRGDAAALRDALGTMLEEVQRMNALIDRLLRLARLESEPGPGDLRTLHLHEHLSAWRDSLLVLAEEKQVRLDLACAPSVAVVADSALLGHAVINILHNAIRHTPAGSAVRVSAYHDGGRTLIEIADRGPGVPAAHRPRIFERFYRIDPARAAAGGAAGLGLCIAQVAVHRLGGTIAVGDAPEGGALFSIALPTQPAPET
ncbi:MAG: sensor histidine kinase [Verrucomicrobia bacterium]|nr:sensor histidine kinase [Verrucomicrobiota bacterium]